MRFDKQTLFEWIHRDIYPPPDLDINLYEQLAIYYLAKRQPRLAYVVCVAFGFTGLEKRTLPEICKKVESQYRNLNRRKYRIDDGKIYRRHVTRERARQMLCKSYRILRHHKAQRFCLVGCEKLPQQLNML